MTGGDSAKLLMEFFHCYEGCSTFLGHEQLGKFGLELVDKLTQIVLSGQGWSTNSEFCRLLKLLLIYLEDTKLVTLKKATQDLYDSLSSSPSPSSPSSSSPSSSTSASPFSALNDLVTQIFGKDVSFFDILMTLTPLIIKLLTPAKKTEENVEKTESPKKAEQKEEKKAEKMEEKKAEKMEEKKAEKMEEKKEEKKTDVPDFDALFGSMFAQQMLSSLFSSEGKKTPLPKKTETKEEIKVHLDCPPSETKSPSEVKARDETEEMQKLIKQFMMGCSDFKTK